MTTLDDIQRVAAEHDIAPEGYRNRRSPPCREWTEEQSVREVEAARQWIRATPPRKTPSGSSYGWKHVMEAETGVYVMNGEFLVAAILEGRTVVRYPDSLNGGVAISKKEPHR